MLPTIELLLSHARHRYTFLSFFSLFCLRLLLLLFDSEGLVSLGAAKGGKVFYWVLVKQSAIDELLSRLQLAA